MLQLLPKHPGDEGIEDALEGEIVVRVEPQAVDHEDPGVARSS